MADRRLLTGLLALIVLVIGCGMGAENAHKLKAAQKESMEEPPSQAEFDQPERKTRRLPPSAFNELPVEVKGQLENRGCTVPQVSGSLEVHNVISGEFARKGQTDWAVLCSMDRKLSIHIFWGMPTNCSSELTLAEDEAFFQEFGDGRMEYSRNIAAVSKDYILDHYNRYGGLTPPPLDHQGIEDIFVEKGSVIHYCYQGTWLKLTGVD